MWLRFPKKGTCVYLINVRENNVPGDALDLVLKISTNAAKCSLIGNGPRWQLVSSSIYCTTFLSRFRAKAFDLRRCLVLMLLETEWKMREAKRLTNVVTYDA